MSKDSSAAYYDARIRRLELEIMERDAKIRELEARLAAREEHARA